MTTVMYNESMGDMDIIFAGGGTAACVAAGRLAKANPDLKILIIEGGTNNYLDPTVVNPAMYQTHLAPGSKTSLAYKSKASSHLLGRELIVPMGGILGGGSSINFMMYSRAQPIDFDSWNTEGWSAKDMMPLCRKLETFHQVEEGIDISKHGYDGPIHVSDGGFRGKFQGAFMESIKAMGEKEIIDLQGFGETGGWTRTQHFISPEGKRQDAAHAYIHPLLQDGQHPNLHLLLESKVTRIIFDDSDTPRATGVEYVTNPDYQVSTVCSTSSGKSVVKAKRLVVISAGSLGTPQILERSGVGNSELLKNLDIKLVSNLPGVGENYQDHPLVLWPYKSNLTPEDTVDALFSGRKDFRKAIDEKDPMLGWNGIDAAGKLRISDEEVLSLGSDFHKDWATDYAPFPTRPAMMVGVVSGFLGNTSLIESGQYVTMGNYSPYPYSRGSIHITSISDILNGYSFDCGLLKHSSDLKMQVWAYKKCREIMRRLSCYRGEVELAHPQFPTGSNAAPSERDVGRSQSHISSIRDIIYSKDDDAAIENSIKANVGTTWHSIGTCAMKERHALGVVDKNLDVYGTTALKLVDLSILPENVGANTNNTALAVGEKAALIIGRDLALSSL